MFERFKAWWNRPRAPYSPALLLSVDRSRGREVWIVVAVDGARFAVSAVRLPENPLLPATATKPLSIETRAKE